MTNYGIEQTLWNSYDTTELDIENEPVGHTATTDVVYLFDSGIPNTDPPGPEGPILAQYRCVYDLGPGLQCDHAHVAYNNDQLLNMGWNVDTPQNRQNMWTIACHETGHTVGVTHGRNADPEMPDDDPVLKCMRTPFVADTSVGAHNVAHINATT